MIAHPAVEHRARPFSLRIFLPHGDPDGLRVVEKSNWTGVGLVFQRSGYPDSKTRDEFERTGVYVLVGTTDDSSQPTIYIGEGDPVRPRLDSHHGKKDFWDWAVFFVSKDSGLNKAHVRYLEHRLIQLAREAKQSRLDNVVSSGAPSLTEAEQADMDSFLADMLSIFPLVGLSVFEKPDPERPGAEVLSLRGRGALARGYESANGFVVQAGSRVAHNETGSAHNYIRTMRKDLRDQGVIADQGDHWTFTQDYRFNSPSTAAGVVIGGNSNGRIAWKTQDGRTLKQLQIAAAGAEDA